MTGHLGDPDDVQGYTHLQPHHELEPLKAMAGALHVADVIDGLPVSRSKT